MEAWRLTLDETRERLLKCYEFISQYKLISDSHSVDYFTEDHWECLIPDKWKIDLLSLQSAESFLYPELFTSDSSLKEFLCSIQELKLLSTHLTQKSCPLLQQYDPSCIDQYGMTQKKRHEVINMANFISSLTLPLGIKQVIDIGSGKGYLSQYLSFCHNFNVIGIESQSITTNSALERCRKVEKLFTGSKKGTHHRESDSNICYPSDETIFQENLDLILEPITTVELTHAEPIATSEPTAIADLTTTVEQTASVELTNTIEPTTIEPTTIEPTTIEPTINVKPTCTSTVKPITIIEPVTTVEPLVEPSTEGTCKKSSCTNAKNKDLLSIALSQSYKPITHCLNVNDDIIQIVSNSIDCHQSTALVGLHTCGDLASFIIRQFVQQDICQVLCVVGCCYHHITEGEILESPATATSSEPVGFPMSNCLKKCGAVLGRNSRMLSCQNEAQFLNITSGKALQSIFYRAILQVILQKEMKLIQSQKEARELCVGRIKKYSNFVDYTRKALINLNIPTEEHPSVEVIEEYYHYHVPHLKKLQLFLQVRAVLAPVIESLILLDRLLFLLENKNIYNIKEAWLCQLFYPSLSPRCIAICAIKENKTKL